MSSLLVESHNILFNILIFVVIQSIFFFTVSAGFVNNIISDKVGRISDLFYKQLQRPQKLLLLEQLKEDKVKIQDKAEQDKKTRDTKNINDLLIKMGIPAGVAIVLFLITGFAYGFSFWYVYVFMFTAYATEVGVFFILMNRFEYIGTFEILDIINDNLPDIGLGTSLGRSPNSLNF